MNLHERVELLIRAENDPKLQAVLMELCRKDPVYWFNTFCWTTNPRKNDYDLPFILYPYQEWCVQDWVDSIEQGIDINIEKSRDMGATWVMILLLQWGWLFKKGWSFHCGSKREDEVCNALIDPDSTIFGKFRFNLYRLPLWMRPAKDQLTDKKLNIQNGLNGNILTGESANPSFGRSRRYKAIFFDELAFWDNAEPAYEGCADVTNCRIVISTPNGEGNMYYRLMHDKNNEVREFPEQEQVFREKGLVA